MKCKKCGTENTEDSNFCIQCGNKLEKNPKKKALWKIIVPIVILVVAIAGGIAGKYVYDQQQLKKELSVLIDDCATVGEWFDKTEKVLDALELTDDEKKKLSDYADRAKDLGERDYKEQIQLVKEWKQFRTDVLKRIEDEKKEKIKKILAEHKSIKKWCEYMKDKFEKYILDDKEKAKLDKYIEKLEDADESDYDKQIDLMSDLLDLQDKIVEKLDKEAKKKIEELKEKIPDFASNEQRTTLAGYAKKAQDYFQNQDYTTLKDFYSDWEQEIEDAGQKKSGYDVTVTQKDLTQYPVVRLYLDVRDSGNKQVIKNLANHMFFISEKAANNADYVKRQVDKAVLMNENERLNINLLADTSGSMKGDNLQSAKSIMKNFLATVQFSAGDMVKLTQFNSEIEKNGYFTDDLGALNNTIDGYSATGQTKLYDAIIYGVQDASGQEGAKCVMAFTDGMDVGSYNGIDDVINVVSRYQIPVFIIRIGDESNALEDQALARIAETSGGEFKNLSQFSSEMNEFYEQIYRKMKEYYVVEYQTEASKNLDAEDVNVYVQNDTIGGETTINMNPQNELLDTILGDYLRNYILDMNDHNYNRLEQYVDNTVDADDEWSIQWQMKKQVSGGFANVEEESIMDYSIDSVSMEDADTILLKANENYDVKYREVYGNLKNSTTDLAAREREYLENNFDTSLLQDDDVIYFWAKVNQSPSYIMKKINGSWKFSKYTESLSLHIQNNMYYAEIAE